MVIENINNFLITTVEPFKIDKMVVTVLINKVYDLKNDDMADYCKIVDL